MKALIAKCKQYYRWCKLKRKIIRFLKKDPHYNDPEIAEIVGFLKRNHLTEFPYDFVKRYDFKKIIVHTDLDNGLKYVLHDNKRLYFARVLSEDTIRRAYTGLLRDQDIDSPHRYETPDFHVNEGDVVVDAGSAEGNFALSVVEKVKKIYLFEVNEHWIEALKATFAPWKDKVEIVCKYVSDNDGDNCVALDTFFGKDKIDFIKADIEGAELALVKGSRNILSGNDKLKVILCTYHNADDAQQLESMLTESGFKTEFSKGYMIFRHDRTLDEPYLRKGLIRGRKV